MQFMFLQNLYSFFIYLIYFTNISMSYNEYLVDWFYSYFTYLKIFDYLLIEGSFPSFQIFWKRMLSLFVDTSNLFIVTRSFTYEKNKRHVRILYQLKNEYFERVVIIQWIPFVIVWLAVTVSFFFLLLWFDGKARFICKRNIR